MRRSIQIGKLTFKTKKDALAYFRNILNSYDYGEIINPTDFEKVYELLQNHYKAKEKIGLEVVDIRVEKLRYNNKGFLLVRKDLTTDFFSYIKCINGRSSPFQKFSKVCRELIRDDIRNVKLLYFKSNSKKGYAKCQETNKFYKWEELVVDHRQPNTFSIIVDRFIEVNRIDLEKIEYIDTEIYGSKFADNVLTKRFKKYHKEKANLRIVKRQINQSRAFQARIGNQKKDLKIE